MDPVHPQNLSERPRREMQHSSLRNPDGFFPERDAPMPDPIGVWAVRFISSVGDWTSDRWAALRALSSQRDPGGQPAQTTRSQG
jgi:hypothetical protein